MNNIVRFRARLNLASSVAVLTLVSCAAGHSVTELILHSSRLDGKDLAVRGVVCEKNTGFSKKTGAEFATYRLCDKRHWCIRVFGYDYNPSVKDGELVVVAGTFEMITIEDPDIYLNELHPDTDDAKIIALSPSNATAVCEK